MEIEEAKAIFEKLTYKKHYRLIFRENPWNFSYEMVFTYMAPDADGLVPMDQQIVGRYEIPIEQLKYLNRKAFLKLIHHNILQVELHEINEWLRIDGEFINDPHPEIRAMQANLERQALDLGGFALEYLENDRMASIPEAPVKPEKKRSVIPDWINPNLKSWWNK